MTTGLGILLCCVIAISSSAHRPMQTQQDAEKRRAIQATEERSWANKERLSLAVVRRIVQGAGLEDADDFHIEILDAHTLRSRNQVLLATRESGTGKCLEAHILQRQGSSFRKVWSAAGAGGDNFCSPGVCGGATAYATLENITVQVPLNCDDLLGKVDPYGEVEIRCVKFAWKSAGYGVAESQEKSILVPQYRRTVRHCSPPH